MLKTLIFTKTSKVESGETSLTEQYLNEFTESQLERFVGIPQPGCLAFGASPAALATQARICFAVFTVQPPKISSRIHRLGKDAFYRPDTVTVKSIEDT